MNYETDGFGNYIDRKFEDFKEDDNVGFTRLTMPLRFNQKAVERFKYMESHPTSVEGVKRLSELLIESTTWYDGEVHLTPEQEDALEWARDFMRKYEHSHKPKG